MYQKPLEKSSKRKLVETILRGCSMFATLTLDDIENRQDVRRGEDWMKTIFDFLKKHAIEIINFQKKKMVS